MAQTVPQDPLASPYINSNSTGDFWQMSQPSYAPQHQHTIPIPSYTTGSGTIAAPPTFPSPIYINLPEDVAGLVEMLELEPIEFDEHFTICVGEKRYSFVGLLEAQMQFMMRINILLVHRSLGESE